MSLLIPSNNNTEQGEFFFFLIVSFENIQVAIKMKKYLPVHANMLVRSNQSHSYPESEEGFVPAIPSLG